MTKSHGGARKGSGRPPGAKNKVPLEIRNLARSFAPEAITELHRIGVSSQSDTARVSAISALLDRAYGKPKQPIGGEDDDSPVVIAHTIELVAPSVVDDGTD